MTAGELLRTVGRRHGLTQQQLAARARTSHAAISRIERDRVSPSVATLAGLRGLMSEELRLDAEPIDYGHDVTLIGANLRRTVSERLRRQEAGANAIRRLQRELAR